MFYSSLVLERQRVAQLCNIPAPDVHMLKYFLFFFYFFFFPTASIKTQNKRKKNIYIEMLPCLVRFDTENRFVLWELYFRIVLDKYCQAA